MLMSHDIFMTARESGNNSFMVQEERAGKIRRIRSNPIEYGWNAGRVVAMGK